MCVCVYVCVFICPGSRCEMYCFTLKINFLLRFLVKTENFRERECATLLPPAESVVIYKHSPYSGCIWELGASTEEEQLSKYAKSTRILASGILDCQNQRRKIAWQAQHLSWCPSWMSHRALKIGLVETSLWKAHPSYSLSVFKVSSGLWTFFWYREKLTWHMGLGQSEDQRSWKQTCAIRSAEDSDLTLRMAHFWFQPWDSLGSCCRWLQDLCHRSEVPNLRI